MLTRFRFEAKGRTPEEVENYLRTQALNLQEDLGGSWVEEETEDGTGITVIRSNGGWWGRLTMRLVETQ